MRRLWACLNLLLAVVILANSGIAAAQPAPSPARHTYRLPLAEGRLAAEGLALDLDARALPGDARVEVVELTISAEGVSDLPLEVRLAGPSGQAQALALAAKPPAKPGAPAVARARASGAFAGQAAGGMWRLELTPRDPALAGVALGVGMTLDYTSADPAAGAVSLPGDLRRAPADAATTEEKPAAAPNGAASPAEDGAEVLFADDFTGLFPGDRWTLLSRAGSGRYWGDTLSCIPARTSWSIWPAALGDNRVSPCDGDYPADLFSVAQIGPFDLTGGAAAQVRFDLWHDIEPLKDGLGLFVSTDGNRFSLLEIWDGAGDWTEQKIDLTAYLSEPSLYIAWVFASNGSNPAPYAGPFLDNVRVLKWAPGSTLPPTPTPRPSPPAPPRLVDGSLAYHHKVVFSSGTETIDGGTLHTGDKIWLSAGAINPAGIAQELVLDVELRLGSTTVRREVRQTIPAYSSAQLTALESEQFFITNLRQGQFDASQLIITVRPRNGTPAASLSASVRPRPVVCLHGYTGTPSGCDNYKSYLEAMGVEVFVIDTMDMGRSDDPISHTGKTIDQNAQALRDYVDQIRRASGATDVILLAHSMGGLVSRNYIHSYMPVGPRSVHALVMLGTPNEGSFLAWLAVDTMVHRPSTGELVPEAVRRFNSRIQNRYGVSFYMVAGIDSAHGDINPFNDKDNPLLWGNDDCVVSLDSTRAIAASERIVSDVACQENSLHTRLANDRGIFDSQIRPLIYELDGLGAAAPASVSLAAASAARQTGSTTPAAPTTPVKLDLGVVVAEPGVAANYDIILDNVADVTVAISGGDASATAALRIPGSGDVALTALPVTSPLLPRFAHTMPSPAPGRYRLTLRSATPATFSILVVGRPIDNKVHLSAPESLAHDRPTLTLTATLTSELSLRQVRLTTRLVSPSGVRRTVRLTPGADGEYAGTVALNEAGLYTAVVRAEGRLNGQRFVRVHTMVIESTVSPAALCYAVAGNDEPHDRDDVLVVIDPANGLAAPLGALGTSSVESLALAPDGRAYVAVEGSLGLLDLRTGQVTPQAIPIGKARGSLESVQIDNISGLAFDATSGHLIGVNRRGSARPNLLVRIDPTTGQLVPDAFGAGQDYVAINGVPAKGVIQDIALESGSAQLYGVVNLPGKDSLLMTIDLVSGAATLLGSTREANLQSIAIGADGSIYATSGNTTTGDALFRLDPVSGLASSVGALGPERDYEALGCGRDN